MRESLVMYLDVEPDLEVCGAVESAEEALAQVFALPVDLMLVDVSLPGMNGIDLVRHLHIRQPDLLCLIVSGHDEGRYAAPAREAGAVGYVMKDSADAVIEAIRNVLKAH